MKPILFLYRSYSSCRNAAAALDAHGVEYEARECFKEPFTREELRSVLGRARMGQSQLVATISTPWRSEGLGEQNLSEEGLLEKMLGKPRLVRRPILVTDDGVTVGYSREQYEDIGRQLAGADR